MPPRPPLSIAALGLALALALTAGAARAQGPAWQSDLEVDLALGVLEDDPSLLRVLTEEPEPRRRLERGQPFNQQPPAAQTDFRPVIEGATPCVPGPNAPCR